MSIMRAQLPRELHAYGDMVGNRAGLDTGAPSITYQGQEGPQAGNQQLPQELIIQLQEAYKQHRAQGGQLTFEEFVEVVMTQNQNRQQAAFGGIMGADGRKRYLWGSIKKFAKKVKDDIIPNELKNPVGAIAAATAANYLPVMMGGDNTLIQKGIGAITGKTPENNALDFMKNIFTGNKTAQQTKTTNTNETPEDYDVYQEQDSARYPTQNKNSSFVRDMASGLGSALLKPEFLIPAAGLISGAFAKEDDPGYTGQGTGLNLRDIGKIANISDEKVGQAAGLRFLPQVSARKYTPEEMIETYATTEAEDFSTPEKAAQGGRIGYDMGGDVGEWEMPEQFLEDFKRRDIDKLLEDFRRWKENQETFDLGPGGMEVAQGGRIGAQDGGLMSLGGMEMDLRGGGFVPIGEREKADDVPARLSKNEFVFTADAVRAAGDGDVNKGADKMYRTMKDLEGMVA